MINEFDAHSAEALAISKYGSDPYLFAAQRDGFIEGFRAAMNELEVTKGFLKDYEYLHKCAVSDSEFWKKSFEERTADWKKQVDRWDNYTVAKSEDEINKWARKMKLDFTKPSDFALGWRKCYEWIIGVYP